jgi:hypothetical protein
MAKLEQFVADHLLLMGAVGIGVACLQVSEAGNVFPQHLSWGKTCLSGSPHPCSTQPPFPLQPKMNHSISLIPPESLKQLELSGTRGPGTHLSVGSGL